jgi:hypothetical protein
MKPYRESPNFLKRGKNGENLTWILSIAYRYRLNKCAINMLLCKTPHIFIVGSGRLFKNIKRIYFYFDTATVVTRTLHIVTLHVLLTTAYLSRLFSCLIHDAPNWNMPKTNLALQLISRTGLPCCQSVVSLHAVCPSSSHNAFWLLLPIGWSLRIPRKTSLRKPPVFTIHHAFCYFMQRVQ